MIGDESLNVTELGSHEVKEKTVTAGVDGDQIDHQTQPPGEAQELEERKRRLAAEAFVRAKQERAAAATSPAKGDPKRNQGSVVAVVVIVGVLVLLVAGFGILMWRLSKSESAIKEHLLTFARDR